jgi:hypothetical protein
MLLGNDAMRNSTSRLGPMIEGIPRLAAMQTSSSLASNSRTWFSTGTNNADGFDFIFLLNAFHLKDIVYDFRLKIETSCDARILNLAPNLTFGFYFVKKRCLSSIRPKNEGFKF